MTSLAVLLNLCCICAWAHAVAASGFVPPPSSLTTVVSQRWPGASIDYKQTTVCETSAKAWSGYVHMPATVLNRLENVEDTFDSHLFFWYFESRNDPANAPTAIFLGGGPGYTSLDQTTGLPCNINAFDRAEPNPYSWNNNVNMLYIDQPAGVGYSYATLRNGSYNTLNHTFTPLEDADEITDIDYTNLPATMDPNPPETTVSLANQAARVLWQFAQIFFQEFPQKPNVENKLSIWGGSYGGVWAPAALSHFIDQNNKICDQTHPNENATFIPMGTLGIVNGLVDYKVQAEHFPAFAYNNTYGIQIINETVSEELVQMLSAPETGCYDLIDQCRAVAAAFDPTGQGNNETVNAACVNATAECNRVAMGFYGESGIIIRDDVDDFFTSFFNQRWVQEDLGVYKNFTYNVEVFQTVMFGITGDPMRTSKSVYEHILDNGVNVAYLFGDRDFACNWLGGEAASLAVEHAGAPAFRAAGYADIEVNSSYTGGVVRQHAGVSFSRIFDAQHAVSHGQPETSLLIFERAMFGRDVATGQMQVTPCYSTPGPSSSWCRNRVPAAEENVCVIYKAQDSCSEEQKLALEDGSAVVEDFVLSSPGGEKLTDMTIIDGPELGDWCH